MSLAEDGLQICSWCEGDGVISVGGDKPVRSSLFNKLVEELNKAQLSLDVLAEDAEEAGYPNRALEAESHAASIRALLLSIKNVL